MGDKLCHDCHTDVSDAGVTRFKDAKGRYFCAACAARRKQTSARSQQPASAAGREASAPLEVAPLQVAPLEVAPLETEPPEAGAGPSPAMPRPAVTPDSKGPPGRKRSRKPIPCKQCGYDLTGIRTTVCPECGTDNPLSKRRVASDSVTLKSMFLTPLIIIGIAVPIAAAANYFDGDAGVAGVVGSLIGYAVSWPVGFVVYFLLSLWVIGFDEPLGVTFVRLGAVYAVNSAVGSLLDLTPLPRLAVWPLQMFIYVGLMMQIMEIDLQDAWLVVVGSFAAWMIVGMVAMHYLA